MGKKEKERKIKGEGMKNTIKLTAFLNIIWHKWKNESQFKYPHQLTAEDEIQQLKIICRCNLYSKEKSQPDFTDPDDRKILGMDSLIVIFITSNLQAINAWNLRHAR